MQAKDIPESEILVAIRELGARDPRSWPRGVPYVSLWKIQEYLTQYPPKVVFARLRSMVRRRVIGAQCTCGCRGDFTLDPDYWYPRPAPNGA